MSDLRLKVRHALGRKLGQVLTPSVAVEIEMAIVPDPVHPPDAGVRIVNDAWRVLAFLKKHMAIGASEHMRGIGLERDGRLVAGVLYVDCNGSSVATHIAGEPGAAWMTRAYLRAIFHYPFREMGVNQILCWVEDTNLASNRFVKHLGFKPVALLPAAGAGAVDVTLYRMKKEECRHA